MSVHGVFPYLYVPYDGSAPVDVYLEQFAASIDKAINIAHGKTMSRAQHVYKLSLVSGMYVSEHSYAFYNIITFRPHLGFYLSILYLNCILFSSVG